MTPEQQQKLDDELVSFASLGDIDRVKAVVSLGATTAYDRSLALRRAAREGRDSVVEFLLQNGADIHAQSDEALRYAVANGRTSTVALLLKKGADANALDGDPLIKAATRGDATMVRDLLVAKANPHASDDQALRMASFNGHAAAVRVLLKFKADPFAMRGSAAAFADAKKFGDVREALAEAMNEQRETFLFDLKLQQDALFWLLLPYGDTGEYGFIRAMKMNLLDAAVDKLKQENSWFGPSVMEMKDRNGISLAQLAAEQGKLKKLFDPLFWRLHFDGMKEAWDKLPETLRKQGGMSQDDFEAVVAEVRRNGLKPANDRYKFKTGSTGPR